MRAVLVLAATAWAQEREHAVEVVLHAADGSTESIERGGRSRIVRSLAERFGAAARVSVVGSAVNATFELERDARFLGEGYAERVVSDGAASRRFVDRTRCHYRGFAVRGETRRRAVVSVCSGSFRAAVPDDEGAFDVAFEGGRHVWRESASSSDFVDPGGVPLPPPAAKERRRLRSGECANSGLFTDTKYAAIVAFNDAARTAERGLETSFDETALVFAQVFDVYAAESSGVLDDDLTTGGLKGDGSLFACDLRPVLIGQVAWVDDNPTEITYAQGPAACDACCSGSTFPCSQECTEEQVSSLCLLDSISTASETWRPDLQTFLAYEHDVSFLVTGRDLDSNTVGIAFIGGACRRNAAGAVVSSYAETQSTRLAVVAAHELGHLLDMQHDAGNDANVMAAGLGALQASSVVFSDESRTYARDWFSDSYGGVGIPACMDDVVSSEDATDDSCGDGVVSGAEECDPGVGIDDACCVGCRLANGCECAVTDACCDASGAVRPAGFSCRAKLDASSCDVEEVCDGEHSACPVDLFAPAGTTCTSPVSGDSRGNCFRGKCRGAGDSCVGYVNPDGNSAEVFCASISTCSRTYCAEPNSFDCYLLDAAPDGAPCSSSRMCLARALEDTVGLDDDGVSECVSFERGRFYRWQAAASCSEQPTCLDELGDFVDTSNCEAALEPEPSGDCTLAPTYPLPTTAPTLSVAPTATSLPTPPPSLPPTSAPSSSAAPTRTPTVPGGGGGEKDDGSSSNKSILSRVGQVSFVVQVAAIVAVVVLATCLCVFCSRRGAPSYQPASPPRNPIRPATHRRPVSTQPTVPPVARARYADDDRDDHTIAMVERPPPPSYPPQSYMLDTPYNV